MNLITEFQDAENSAALARLLFWRSSKTSRLVSTWTPHFNRPTCF